MTDSLVSCVIPVRNGELYLGETLQSVFDQTHRSLEAIVVDDGSTDRSAEICAHLGGQVRLFQNERALGPAAARNRGVRVARGEFVAFLDHDDLWAPRKLELQLARFVERPELGFTVTRIHNFWVPELRAEADRFRDHPRSRPADGYMAQTLMVRKETFDQVGPFDESLAHTSEPDWFIRAREAGVHEELIPELLVRRRIHPVQRSRRRAAQSQDDYFEFLRKAVEEKRGHGVENAA